MSSSIRRNGGSLRSQRSPTDNRTTSEAPLDDQQAQQHAIAIDESANTAARNELIRLAAYYRAQNRGFVSGGELSDWLAAETEVDLSLRRSGTP